MECNATVQVLFEREKELAYYVNSVRCHYYYISRQCRLNRGGLDLRWDGAESRTTVRVDAKVQKKCGLTKVQASDKFSVGAY